VTPPVVLFDIDGTLLSFHGVGRLAMERAMEEVWGIAGALRGISFAGATDGLVAARVAPHLPRAPMWGRYVEHLAANVRAMPAPRLHDGVVELLDALDVRGARVGLLTGNLRAGAAIKLEAVGILHRFDLAVSAFAEDGDARAEIAAAARRRAGDAPISIVGDTVADIACARHIGARVVAVATGGSGEEALAAAGPDLLVRDLTATEALAAWLAGPSHAPASGRPAPRPSPRA
jgi:phosphoglycolate phosphatase